MNIVDCCLLSITCHQHYIHFCHDHKSTVSYIFFSSEFWMIFTILSTYVSFLKPNNSFDFYIFISDFQRKLLTYFVKSLNYLSFSNKKKHPGIRSSKEMKFCSLGLFEQIQSRLLRLMTNPLGYNSTITHLSNSSSSDFCKFIAVYSLVNQLRLNDL